MARQKGIFKLSGTIGEINYYHMNGKAFARKAGGGFTAQAIKSKASMQRVRENGKEFGLANAVKKKLLHILQPELVIKGRSTHGKIVGLFLKLKNLDYASERGKRSVLEGLKTEEGQRLLRNFAFSKSSSFMDVISAGWNFDKQTSTLQLPAFNPVHYPELTKSPGFRISFFAIEMPPSGPFKKHLLDSKIVQSGNELCNLSLVPHSPITFMDQLLFYVVAEKLTGSQGVEESLGLRFV